MAVTAHLHAYLSYRDAPAALAWLDRVGFVVAVRQDNADGTVAHAEVHYGDVVLMVVSRAGTACPA
jgi:uncharacterized glyoxalase superfamily protein PhnB